MIAASSHAAGQKEVQDMSDPLAVYTQVGVGATNKGLNFKVGQAYDTGIATTAGMNVIEVKAYMAMR
jgi:D-serine dehydratase